MTTELRLVKRNWRYGMTFNGEDCLVLRQSLNINLKGGSGHAPREILKFRWSEIAGNS